MLNDQQIECIRAEIKRSGLTLQTLEDDLLDHFCCFVEIEMERGSSFQNAYQKAQEQICPNGFFEIQDETLTVLNRSKITNMKKIIYLVGLVSSMVFTVGWLFTLLRWPGGQELFTGGFLGFTLVFLPLLFIDRYKASISKALSERLKIILGFSSAMLTAFSVIFKLMHLQGANILLVVGVLLFSFGFLPFLFFGMYKKATAE